MAKDHPMQMLYSRLENAGLSRHYVRNVVLPAWWDDDLGETRSGFMRAAGMIASFVQADLRSLLDPAAPVAFRSNVAAQFKKNRDVTNCDVVWSKCVATALARMACSVIRKSLTPLPENAKEVRRAILLRDWDLLVNLSTLLDYLWSHGIPVLHAAELPKGRFGGMVASFSGRPVIIVADRRDIGSLLAFIVAHEIGHILRKHLGSDDVILDSTLEEASASTDRYELEASRDGCEILTGTTEPYVLKAQFAIRMLSEATLKGADDRVEPGSVILSNAKRVNTPEGWKAAFSAIKKLPQEKGAIKLMRDKMCEMLDLRELHDEDRAFFQRVTRT